jgi:hypothetical protein
LAAAGLQALDYVEKKQGVPEAWRAEQVALVQSAGKPAADLNWAIVAGIQKLIEGAASAK